jgi:hypothetical protein
MTWTMPSEWAVWWALILIVVVLILNEVLYRGRK